MEGFYSLIEIEGMFTNHKDSVNASLTVNSSGLSCLEVTRGNKVVYRRQLKPWNWTSRHTFDGRLDIYIKKEAFRKTN